MKSFILTVVLSCLLFPAQLLAENPAMDAQMRSKWFKEVQSYKYEFFTKELELTAEQSDKFFPVYEEMEKAVYTVNKEARDLEDKIVQSAEEISELEYEAATNVLYKVKQKEGEIELEYYQKFNEILSKKQLFLLKIAENKFTQSILNHHKKVTNNK